MTILIILLTIVISTIVFRHQKLMYRFQFNAYQILKRRQFFRLFTHAFLHASWEHLGINMMVLYFFGTALEQHLLIHFGSATITIYLLLYFSSIIISSLPDLRKHRNNYYYNAVGASGAVSAIVYATIFFAPLQKIYFFFIIPIPGILFAVLYLYYSYYMSKKNTDHIGHSAHFWGALFGFLFPLLIKPKLFSLFLHQLLNF